MCNGRSGSGLIMMSADHKIHNTMHCWESHKVTQGKAHTPLIAPHTSRIMCLSIAYVLSSKAAQQFDTGFTSHLHPLDVRPVPVIGQQGADGAWCVGQVIQRLKQGHLCAIIQVIIYSEHKNSHKVLGHPGSQTGAPVCHSAITCNNLISTRKQSQSRARRQPGKPYRAQVKSRLAVGVAISTQDNLQNTTPSCKTCTQIKCTGTLAWSSVHSPSDAAHMSRIRLL